MMLFLAPNWDQILITPKNGKENENETKANDQINENENQKREKCKGKKY